MSYKTTTFKKAIDLINSRKMLLPAIQRRFVWGSSQIEKLFDSMMRDYPIGSFLFWKVQPQAVHHYAFYEFMKDYHQRDKQFNDLAPKGFTPTDSIIGVLDGQQRLSSIYIALAGTYTYKLPYYSSNNEKAYPKRRLCLNLLYQTTEESRFHYEFKFLTDKEENNECTSKHYWFPVSEMLSWKEAEYNDEWFDNAIEELENYNDSGELQETIDAMKTFKRDIKKTLAKLFYNIHRNEILNYFEVENDNIDSVLEIFVRVNSGGKVLSKSDLLFSTIVAHWNDGRDNMEDLLKKLNKKGFSFDSDFIVRACQMLALENVPLKLEVKNFTFKNVNEVKVKWDEIEDALLKTVDWLVEYGYSRDTLSSQNAVLPIAYYIFNGGNKKSKDDWRRYLSHALIKNLYSSRNDQFLEDLRRELKKKKVFKFDEWLSKTFTSGKKFVVTEEDIEEILGYKKGRNAFVVLAMLYNFKHSQMNIDLDHVHPYSGFTNAKLKKISIIDDIAKEWQNKRDQLPNLQMMDSSTNRSKNATPLEQWVDKTFTNKIDRDRFFSSSYFPAKQSLEFTNFDKFFNNRKDIMRKEFKKIFKVK